MFYLVAKVQGKIPAGATVRVQTAKVSGGAPAGKADLNIRNSPAPISTVGLTPLPRMRQCLIVRGWSIGAGGTPRPSPFYDLLVLAPSNDPGTKPQVIARDVIEPKASWFRAEPDRAEPTLEIKLK